MRFFIVTPPLWPDGIDGFRGKNHLSLLLLQGKSFHLNAGLDVYDRVWQVRDRFGQSETKYNPISSKCKWSRWPWALS